MRYEVLLSSFSGRLFLFSAFTFPVFSNLHWALLFLLFAFIADFLTGWLATYQEIKRGERLMPPSGLSFESNRARESVVKGISYILLILGAAAIEYIFLDRKFKFDTMTSKSFGTTELVIGFCFAIEMYSTLAENMKRAGFDIFGKASKLIDSFWSFKKKLTNG